MRIGVWRFIFIRYHDVYLFPSTVPARKALAASALSEVGKPPGAGGTGLKTRFTPLVLFPRLACRTFKCVVSPLTRTGNDQDPKKERVICRW